MRSNTDGQEQVDGHDGEHPAQGSTTIAEGDRSAGIVGVPDGWEVIRIGTPRPGEHWIGYTDSQGTLEPIKQEYDCGSSRFDMAVAIVQRRAHWQKLWPHQWKETPLHGRFRSHVDSPWEYGTIVQYRPGQMKWRAHDGRWYTTAEVRSMDIPQ